MIIVYSLTAAVILIALGTYALLAKDNLIKKIIGLGIFTDGIHLLLISIGYKEEGIAPIIRDIHFNHATAVNAINTSALNAMVDPLPQALVLTSIVIELSITALALVIIIQIHKKYNTINSKHLRRLKE